MNKDITGLLPDDIARLDYLLDFLKERHGKPEGKIDGFICLDDDRINEEYEQYLNMIKLLAYTGYTTPSTTNVNSNDIRWQKLNRHGLSLSSFSDLQKSQIRNNWLNKYFGWVSKSDTVSSVLRNLLYILSTALLLLAQQCNHSKTKTNEQHQELIRNDVDKITRTLDSILSSTSDSIDPKNPSSYP